MRNYFVLGRELFILPHQSMGGDQAMVVASGIKDGISDIIKSILKGIITYGEQFHTK